MNSLKSLLQDLPLKLPILGVDFEADVWDQEFAPEHMAAIDCAVLKAMIQDEIGSQLISPKLLHKIGYAPKVGILID